MREPFPPSSSAGAGAGGRNAGAPPRTPPPRTPPPRIPPQAGPPPPAPAATVHHAPAARRSGLGWLAAIGAAALLLIGVLAATDRSAPESGNGPGTAIASAGVPTGVPGTRTPVDASTELQRIVDADAGQVNALVDVWVPQVSSKYVGLQADGTTYDEAAILADHRQWAARYPGALLLYTGPFTSFKNRSAYVTVVGETFAGANGAESWCDAWSLPARDCLAKMISRTRGPSGATKNR